MLAVERRIKVLERIAADQAVEVSSLAREFGVSEMTIRRDLRRLDRDGFVRRTYGGATTRVVRSAGGSEATQNARTLHHAEHAIRQAGLLQPMCEQQRSRRIAFGRLEDDDLFLGAR